MNPCSATVLRHVLLPVHRLLDLSENANRFTQTDTTDNRAVQTLVEFNVCWSGKGVKYCEHCFFSGIFLRLTFV